MSVIFWNIIIPEAEFFSLQAVCQSVSRQIFLASGLSIRFTSNVFSSLRNPHRINSIPTRSGLSFLKQTFPNKIIIMQSSALTKVLHLAINLEQSVARRQHVEEQARKVGIPLQIVPAIHGKDLSPDNLPEYDVKRRLKEFPAGMTLNELGCIQSHLKALRLFVESEYDYCVVNEDDVSFHPDFVELLDEILEHTSGWDCIKLWTAPPHYHVLPSQAGRKCELTFPKKFPWESTSILYTKAGAQKMLDAFRRYWLPFDGFLAYACFHGDFVATGVQPDLAWPDEHFAPISEINQDNNRSQNDRKKRTLLQYIFHRFCIMGTSMGKTRMQKRMKASIKFQ